eukprot:gene7396-biopygen18042
MCSPGRRHAGASVRACLRVAGPPAAPHRWVTAASPPLRSHRGSAQRGRASGSAARWRAGAESAGACKGCAWASGGVHGGRDDGGRAPPASPTRGTRLKGRVPARVQLSAGYHPMKVWLWVAPRGHSTTLASMSCTVTGGASSGPTQSARASSASWTKGLVAGNVSSGRTESARANSASLNHTPRGAKQESVREGAGAGWGCPVYRPQPAARSPRTRPDHGEKGVARRVPQLPEAPHLPPYGPALQDTP